MLNLSLTAYRLSNQQVIEIIIGTLSALLLDVLGAAACRRLQ
jgi:hypothetical protein